VRWPEEREVRSRVDREADAQKLAEFHVLMGRPPKEFAENESLRRAVLERIDDDAPRWAYARWMLEQTDRASVAIGELVQAQLRIAEALGMDPGADVSMYGNPVAGPDVRYDLSFLARDGLIESQQAYRGFIESVSVRADRLLEIADELFGLAPIRHVSVCGVPTAVNELAAWPQLARFRSLQLGSLSEGDELTDDVIRRLVSSPYLTNVAYIAIWNQPRLTSRAYEAIVTAPTLPRLSLLQVHSDEVTCWAEPVPIAENAWLELIHNPPASKDLRDTPRPVILRPEDWIVELEARLGYVPCLHPEEHYGAYNPVIEAVWEHPIALDAGVMSRRGAPVRDRGPKLSLAERRARGECPICGSATLMFERGEDVPPAYDPWANPLGRDYWIANRVGTWICDRCGTRWPSSSLPAREPPEPTSSEEHAVWLRHRPEFRDD